MSAFPLFLAAAGLCQGAGWGFGGETLWLRTVPGLILAGLSLAAAGMAALYLIAQRRRNAALADVGWAGGIALLVLFYAIASQGLAYRRILVALLAVGWGLRLALYLLVTRVRGKAEAGRYATLRRDWGSRAPLNFFLFFQAQAMLAVLFSLPFLVVLRNPRPNLDVWDIVGVAVWWLATNGERLADRQLTAFKSDPDNQGRTCREGLWRYSRHPNYFCEWLHWWTYVFMAVGLPWFWVTLAAPLLMLFFLLRVTGIPATEAQALATRGDDYRDYRRTTNAFIPWFPKR